jgi:hypothetical protein
MKSLLTFISIIILFGLIPSKLHAQKSDTAKKLFMVEPAESDELAHLNLTNVNNSLQQNGLAPVRQPGFFLITLTVFPTSFQKRFFAGISGGFGQSQHENADYLTKLNLYVENLNFYYSIFQSRRSLLYPGAGLGLMEYSLLLQNKTTTPSSYQDGLHNLTGEMQMQTYNPYVNFSFNYYWWLSFSWGIRIGIHAGYRLGLNNPTLKLSTGNKLSGAPFSSVNGFYAGIDLNL